MPATGAVSWAIDPTSAKAVAGAKTAQDKAKSRRPRGTKDRKLHMVLDLRMNFGANYEPGSAGDGGIFRATRSVHAPAV